MQSLPRALAALLAVTSIATACHHTSTTPAPAAAMPAAVAATAATTAAPVAADTSRAASHRGYTEADVRFMHHMMMHHAQALVMTAMVPTHDASADVRTVAERITISQRDEIGLMQRWLHARGELAPDVMAPDHMQHASHMQQMQHGSMGDSTHTTMAMPMSMSMPGMLTPAQLAQLDAARGAAFDTLFVRFMIQHHEGALQMVADYLATPGAAQESEIFRFASDVDADQRAEIRRMRGLLAQ